MGGNNSKEDNNNWRQNSSVRSSSSASSWGSYPDPQSGYGHGGYAYEGFFFCFFLILSSMVTLRNVNGGSVSDPVPVR